MLGDSPALIADALADDPARGASEWLGQFRTDIAAFVAADVIAAAVIPGRLSLPRMAGVRYFAFCDPSGGSADSFTLAVSHREGDRAILDHLSEVRPPFSPEIVVSDFAAIIRSYGCSRVTSDRYGGVWVGESFGRHGVVAEQSAAPKSDLYASLLPALNSGRCELLDHPRLAAQLAGLERRTARSGKDSIDHGPGGHDDLANSAAGCLTAVLSRAVVPITAADFIVGSPSPWAMDWDQWQWRN